MVMPCLAVPSPAPPRLARPGPAPPAKPCRARPRQASPRRACHASPWGWCRPLPLDDPEGAKPQTVRRLRERPTLTNPHLHASTQQEIGHVRRGELVAVIRHAHRQPPLPPKRPHPNVHHTRRVPHRHLVTLRLARLQPDQRLTIRRVQPVRLHEDAHLRVRHLEPRHPTRIDARIPNRRRRNTVPPLRTDVLRPNEVRLEVPRLPLRPFLRRRPSLLLLPHLLNRLVRELRLHVRRSPLQHHLHRDDLRSRNCQTLIHHGTLLFCADLSRRSATA